MLEFIGISGSLLLSLCGLPQAVQSLRNRHSHGISYGFIWMWVTGEIALLIYVAGTTADLILIVNYLFNLLIGGVILWFKLFPAKTAAD
ncbi:MAG: hypothetical protein EPN93_12590 [Spirochaetes bacterium]|nr:MAG: hypothetical protein EPN93_12590 [Spirochaetota bacterium]